MEVSSDTRVKTKKVKGQRRTGVEEKTNWSSIYFGPFWFSPLCRLIRPWRRLQMLENGSIYIVGLTSWLWLSFPAPSSTTSPPNKSSLNLPASFPPILLKLIKCLYLITKIRIGKKKEVEKNLCEGGGRRAKGNCHMTHITIVRACRWAIEAFPRIKRLVNNNYNIRWRHQRGITRNTGENQKGHVHGRQRWWTRDTTAAGNES